VIKRIEITVSLNDGGQLKRHHKNRCESCLEVDRPIGGPAIAEIRDDRIAGRCRTSRTQDLPSGGQVSGCLAQTHAIASLKWDTLKIARSLIRYETSEE